MKLKAQQVRFCGILVHTGCYLVPRHLKKYIDFVLSEKVEYCYAIFRGVGYKDVPDRPYDFVFVDGPSTLALSDGTRSFDFNYINVVMKSTKPVFGIIDKRLGTSYVFQKIGGGKKRSYTIRKEICVLWGPSREQTLKEGLDPGPSWIAYAYLEKQN